MEYNRIWQTKYINGRRKAQWKESEKRQQKSAFIVIKKSIETDKTIPNETNRYNINCKRKQKSISNSKNFK